jgi:hypothetical protein
MVDSGKFPSLGARRRLLTFGKVGKFMGKEAPLQRMAGTSRGSCQGSFDGALARVEGKATKGGSEL